MPARSTRLGLIGLFFLTSGATGLAAVLGSMLGHAAGQRWLFLGAIFGGVVGSVCAVQLARWWRWIIRDQQASTVIGSVAGFGLAALIAVNNLSTPVIPALSTALIGVGAVVGSLVSSHWPTRMREAHVTRHLLLAPVGLISLLPAGILVVFGLSGNIPPMTITQPVLVLGGLALAALLNAGSVLRIRLEREDGSVVGSLRMQIREGLVNWGVVAVSVCLGGVILLYLFVENFQPR
jgi:hypothetical protein